jgi:phosphate transport system substrate-binding protein
MSARIIKVIALAIGATFLLTACDPPMPPEVRAALAEQSYTCESGDTQLAAIAPVAAVAGDWQASVESNCPGMTITPVDENTPEAELQVGQVNSGSTAYASVPFAIDAVVITVMLTDITQVNLSADAIAKIAAGQITSWDDPELAALNPNFSMPATQISYTNLLSPAQAAPLTDWLQRISGKDVSLGATAAKATLQIDGSLVVTTYSAAMNDGLQMVAITDDVGSDGVIPESGSIGSAATMFKSKVSNGNVSLTFDSKQKPIAPEGVAVAPAPYQALNVYNLNLCGTDSLKTRAAARYLLRQDSQGSLGLSTVIGIPESLRVVALEVVSKGLPEPDLSATPSQ